MSIQPGRCAGYALSERMTQQLVIKALKQAMQHKKQMVTQCGSSNQRVEALFDAKV